MVRVVLKDLAGYSHIKAGDLIIGTAYPQKMELIKRTILRCFSFVIYTLTQMYTLIIPYTTNLSPTCEVTYRKCWNGEILFTEK